MDLKESALNKNSQRHPWELARIRVVADLIKKRIPAEKSLTILDIGSGDNFLIKELSKIFINAHFFAVDTGYDQDFIAKANEDPEIKSSRIRLFNTLDCAEEAIDQPVDLVLLLDVIEHAPNDVVFLKSLVDSKKTGNNTLFLVTVPSFQFLFTSHDHFLGHYRRYGNTSLKRHLLRANLNIMDIGYFFMLPLLSRFLRKVKEKIVVPQSVAGIGNWQGGQFLSNVLTKVLWADYVVASIFRRFKIKLPGLSNFAICKKYT